MSTTYSETAEMLLDACSGKDWPTCVRTIAKLLAKRDGVPRRTGASEPPPPAPEGLELVKLAEVYAEVAVKIYVRIDGRRRTGKVKVQIWRGEIRNIDWPRNLETSDPQRLLYLHGLIADAVRDAVTPLK